MSFSRPSFRPTYANVVATLALLIAVVGFAGGPSAVASAVKKLAPNSVGTKNLKNNAVTGIKVQDGSLGGADIKNGSLGGIDIADRSIGSQDIGVGQIFDPNMATGSVNSRVLRDNSITSSDIANGTITNLDLAENAITSENIGPLTIKGENIAPMTIGFGNLDPAAVESLTHYSDTGAISKGSTVTGYASIAYVAGHDPADGTGFEGPEVRGLAVSFPKPVTSIVGVAGSGDGRCTGSFQSPTASEGVACFYVKADPGNNPGTASLLDYSNLGFTLKYTPPAEGWTFAQISWAFTRPAA